MNLTMYKYVKDDVTFFKFQCAITEIPICVVPKMIVCQNILINHPYVLPQPYG